MESRAGRTSQRSGWSVGVAELRPGIGLNVGNLVSKEGAATEAVMGGELAGGERAQGLLPALVQASWPGKSGPPAGEGVYVEVGLMV